MATIVAGTVGAVASASQIISGAYELSRRLVELLRPPCLRLDSGEVHYLFCIQRQIESMLRPLEFCVLWGRQRDPLTQQTIWMVEDTLRRVWNRIKCLEDNHSVGVSSPRNPCTSSIDGMVMMNEYSNMTALRIPSQNPQQHMMNPTTTIRSRSHPHHHLSRAARIHNRYSNSPSEVFSKSKAGKQSSTGTRNSSDTVTLLRWSVDELNIAASQLTLALTTVQAHCLARMERSQPQLYSGMARGRRSVFPQQELERNEVYKDLRWRRRGVTHRRGKGKLNRPGVKHRRVTRRRDASWQDLFEEENEDVRDSSSQFTRGASSPGRGCCSISASTLVKSTRHIWSMIGRTGDFCLSSGSLMLYRYDDDLCNNTDASKLPPNQKQFACATDTRSCFGERRDSNTQALPLNHMRDIREPQGGMKWEESPNPLPRTMSAPVGNSSHPQESPVDATEKLMDERRRDEEASNGLQSDPISPSKSWKCIYRKCFLRVTKTLQDGLGGALITIEPIDTPATSSSTVGITFPTGTSIPVQTTTNKLPRTKSTTDIPQQHSTLQHSSSSNQLKTEALPPTIPSTSTIPMNVLPVNSMDLPCSVPSQSTSPYFPTPPSSSRSFSQANPSHSDYLPRQQLTNNNPSHSSSSTRFNGSLSCCPIENESDFLFVSSDAGLSWPSSSSSTFYSNTTVSNTPATQQHQTTPPESLPLNLHQLPSNCPLPSIPSTSLPSIPLNIIDPTGLSSARRFDSHNIDDHPTKPLSSPFSLPTPPSPMTPPLQSLSTPPRLQLSISISLKMVLHTDGIPSTSLSREYTPSADGPHARTQTGCCNCPGGNPVDPTTSSSSVLRSTLPTSQQERLTTSQQAQTASECGESGETLPNSLDLLTFSPIGGRQQKLGEAREAPNASSLNSAVSKAAHQPAKENVPDENCSTSLRFDSSGVLGEDRSHSEVQQVRDGVGLNEDRTDQRRCGIPLHQFHNKNEKCSRGKEHQHQMDGLYDHGSLASGPALVWTMNRDNIVESSALGKTATEWMMKLLELQDEKIRRQRQYHHRGGSPSDLMSKPFLRFAFVFDTHSFNSAQPWRHGDETVEPSAHGIFSEASSLPIKTIPNSTLPPRPRSSSSVKHQPSTLRRESGSNRLAYYSPSRSPTHHPSLPTPLPVMLHQSVPPLQVLYVARLCFLEAASTLTGSRPDSNIWVNHDSAEIEEYNTIHEINSLSTVPGCPSKYPSTHSHAPLGKGGALTSTSLHGLSSTKPVYSINQHHASTPQQYQYQRRPSNSLVSGRPLGSSADHEFSFCHRFEDVWTRVSDEVLEQLLGDCIAN